MPKAMVSTAVKAKTGFLRMPYIFSNTSAKSGD